MKAFPTVFMDYIPKEEHRGMDLRDYFAAKIMQSILVTGKNLPRNYDLFAKDAYEIADLMMQERDK
jgi:hypothetical protein